MDNYMYLVPVAAVVALLFAAYLANKVSKMDAGTDRMKEIADAIAEGARAFLGAEYKILVIFVAVLFVLIGVGIQNWIEAIRSWSAVLNNRRILRNDSCYKS